MPARGAFSDHAFGRIAPLRNLPAIALDSARSADDPLILDAQGDFLWVNGDSDGTAHIRFNDNVGSRFPVDAGITFVGVPFSRLYLDWTAQANKQIVLSYGRGLRVEPGNDIQNIGQITDPVTVQTAGGDFELSPRPFGPTLYYRTSISTALNTIVTPAANVAGVRIDSAWTSVVGNQQQRIMAKATAPSNVADTAYTIAWQSGPDSLRITYPLSLPLIIPAGLGLYEQSNDGTNNSSAEVVYEVLP